MSPWLEMRLTHHFLFMLFQVGFWLSRAGEDDSKENFVHYRLSLHIPS